MFLFMSPEAEREYLDDMAGDGYGSNELARAFAYTSMTTPRTSRNAALRLAAPYLRNGLCAVIVRSTVYCRDTDAIIGDTHDLRLVGSREACAKFAATYDHDDYDGEYPTAEVVEA